MYSLYSNCQHLSNCIYLTFFNTFWRAKEPYLCIAQENKKMRFDLTLKSNENVFE